MIIVVKDIVKFIESWGSPNENWFYTRLKQKKDFKNGNTNIAMYKK